MTNMTPEVSPADHPPIGFVWPEDMPFMRYAGGSEAYTALHIEHLKKLGHAVTFYALGETRNSDLKDLGIPVHALDRKTDLEKVDDTLIFPIVPEYDLEKLRRTSFVILHVPATAMQPRDATFFRENGTGIHMPIVTSNYMAHHWQSVLETPQPPDVVYPPVDPVFSQQPRPPRGDEPGRLLFAGRPTPEKGIYNLFASLHVPPLRDEEYTLTCVKTINHNGGTEIVNALLDAHPHIKAINAQPDPRSMAVLYAAHDVVVMPSIWDEPFGMISVEAQRAGCRVVASDTGGLPETDCGGLVLTNPNDYTALAASIADALRTGPLTSQERSNAARRFTVEDSVTALLRVIVSRSSS